MVRPARYKTNSKRFVQQLTTFEDTLTNLGARVVEQGAEMGATIMREVANNSGTGWPDAREGGPRSDTGAMIEAIDYDHHYHSGISRKGRTSRTARFGWINQYRDYFGYQETGFTNLRKNQKNQGVTWVTGTGGPPGETEGMNAYETAHQEVKQWFIREMDRITRTAWRRTK